MQRRLRSIATLERPGTTAARGRSRAGVLSELLLARYGALAGLAAILVAVVVAYAGTLNDWFTSDDFYFLAAFKGHSASTYFLAAIDPYRAQLLPQGLYRPLSLLNFLWLYHVFGLHAWGYHAVAIIAHVANVILLWVIAYKLTRRVAVAHVAALIFGLHPTYSPAVAWISNSMSVYAMTFGLLALLLSLQFLESAKRSRWLLYAGALIAASAAGLYHPEALVLLAVVCAAHVLVPKRSRREWLSVRTWLPLVPYVAVGIGFWELHQHLRADEAQQQYLFGWGDFVYRNIARNMAMAGNPLGTDWSLAHAHIGNRDWAVDFSNLRTLTPLIGMFVLSFYLLAREVKRPSVGFVVVFWFFLSMLPISTSQALGTPARKLYLAGPPFGLAVGIAVVAIWDRLEVLYGVVRARQDRASHARTSDPAPPEHAQTRTIPVVVPAALMMLVMVAFSVRIAHMTSPDSMGLETHNYGISSSTEKTLVDQIRAAYPDLPPGSRLELLGLPPLLMTPDGIHPRFRDAVELYYDHVTVVGGSSEQDFLAEPPPPGTPTVRVTFHCKVLALSSYIFFAQC